MASITNYDGRRVIQFTAPNGKRRSVRLGKCSKRNAESIKVKIEDLVTSLMSGHAPSDSTSRWVKGLDAMMFDKLAQVGLVQQRPKQLLGPFIDGYIESRSDVKPSTRVVYERVRRYLLDHFDEQCPLRSITQGDADKWRLNLLKSGLAENTVRRSCGVAKQFFLTAVRSGLIDSNPFGDLVAAVRANTSRYYFVTRDETEKVLKACPDAEWCVIFALARYGGLRTPSEVLKLKWNDIDWELARLTVHSPKTEHHDGKATREVPLFPELHPYLLKLFQQAEPGEPYVITRYRSANSNLRTQLQKIIRRAGLEPWPKLFQNLRSTRETELANEFPAHVAAAWIGNSVAVATKHYLQITDDHFNMAVEALQKAVQQPAALDCRELNHVLPASGRPSTNGDRGTKNSEVQNDTNACNARVCDVVGVTGLEPVTLAV